MTWRVLFPRNLNNGHAKSLPKSYHQAAFHDDLKNSEQWLFLQCLFQDHLHSITTGSRRFVSHEHEQWLCRNSSSFNDKQPFQDHLSRTLLSQKLCPGRHGQQLCHLSPLCYHWMGLPFQDHLPSITLLIQIAVSSETSKVTVQSLAQYRH